MIPLNRFYCISTAILLLGLVNQPLAAVVTIDPAVQEQFADTLFDSGQYRRAAEEYQRFGFFFTDHPKRREMILNAGKSFLLAGDPQQALQVLKELTAQFSLDPIAVEAYFLTARGYIQMNAHTHAIVQLNNLIALSDDPSVRDRANYRIAWIHIDRLDWAAGLRALEQMTPDGRQAYGAQAMIEPLRNASNIPQKSPVTAGLLSIVPGGGQLYCHRPKDALIAFVLNVGTFWAAHEAFDNDQVALGSLLGILGVGFYAGNLYGAVNDAHKYNADQRQKFLRLLKHEHQRSDPPRTSSSGAVIIGMRISF